MRKLWMAALLLLVMPCTDLRAQESPETVSLRFAWPAGLEASAKSVRIRSRVIEERTQYSVSSSYELKVVPEGKNLRIDFTEPKIDLEGALSALPEAARAQLVPQLAELTPDYVVSPDGEFVGLHDLAAYQERVEGFFGTLLGDEASSKIPPQLRQLFSSEQFLNARAAEQWNAIVGFWAGAELEIGAETTYTDKEAAPIFPGEEVLMNYAFVAKGVVPCSRGRVERTCVELELRSASDPEDTKRVIEAFVASLAGQDTSQVPIFEDFQVETVIEVLTEVESLIPHRYSTTKTVRTKVSVGGEGGQVEQVDSTVTEYSYP